jgi:hypothetical protein
MKKYIVLAASACLLACTTPQKPEEPRSPVALPEPAKLVHYPHSGFVFCAKGCPAATEKIVLMALDLSSTDAKERVLARLRDQMTRQTSGATSIKADGTVVEVAKAGALDDRRDAWTIYALQGQPESKETAQALRGVVRSATGARFYLLASESAQAEAGAYRAVLGQLGVPPRSASAFVLKAPVKSDLAIASSAAAASSPAAREQGVGTAQMLVIRELGRN